ncbi:MAG TPA: aldo/keto reductase [Candidatus Polarisedimenticolaceae bacterium]|nr:aldo/keto reductase [Candidatus Polarisedimenticolaceae bacterium]
MLRRDVLRIIAAAGAGTALGGRIARATEPATMITRKIPKSGEAIPVIGLGTSRVFDVGTRKDERAPLAGVLDAMIGDGARVIDSSPMYGRAEEVVGDLVEASGKRDRFFLASKVWTKGRKEGADQIEASFRKLRTKHLDLMQVHNLLDLDTQLATLRHLKGEGRIRYVGVSHWNASAYDDLESVLRREDLDFVQLNYSVVEREAEKVLLPLAKDRGVAVLVNRPFAQGQLFAKVKGRALPDWAASLGIASWGQLMLKFVVSHDAVTCAIPATAKPEHMHDDAAAGSGPMPDAASRERIAALFQD